MRQRLASGGRFSVSCDDAAAHAYAVAAAQQARQKQYPSARFNHAATCRRKLYGNRVAIQAALKRLLFAFGIYGL